MEFFVALLIQTPEQRFTSAPFARSLSPLPLELPPLLPCRTTHYPPLTVEKPPALNRWQFPGTTHSGLHGAIKSLEDISKVGEWLVA